MIPIIAYFLSNGTFIIGGAKPVPVDPRNYRRPVLGDICVSGAGDLGQASIHLDGNGGNVWIGSNGRDGDLVLFPSSATNSYNFV